MSHAIDSKSAAAILLDPMNEPEPSAETGPGSRFGSTFAPASNLNGSAPSPTSSTNPYRSPSTKQPSPAKLVKHSPSTKSTSPNKAGASTSVRTSSGSPRGDPFQFPARRSEASTDASEPAQQSRRRAESHGTPPTYREATSTSPSLANNSPTFSDGNAPRRGNSLRERYPGDKSGQPLDIIRRDSKKAYRSHHLHKRSLPGADSIDRLDPAIGGRAYHHEGPYDAALLARNRDPRRGPLYALEDSNQEALKATPRENIKDAVERHKPLDGVAIVPPGVPDRFGRRYEYEEGDDLMHEASGAGGDAGYKRWPGQDYDPDDLKGQSNPTFDLDRALKAHRIDENAQGGIELQDRSSPRNPTHARISSREYHEAERRGELDPRDPVEIAGDDGKYADLEIAEIRARNADLATSSEMQRGVGIRGSLKKRIGSLKKKGREE